MDNVSEDKIRDLVTKILGETVLGGINEAAPSSSKIKSEDNLIMRTSIQIASNMKHEIDINKKMNMSAGLNLLSIAASLDVADQRSKCIYLAKSLALSDVK